MAFSRRIDSLNTSSDLSAQSASSIDGNPLGIVHLTLFFIISDSTRVAICHNPIRYIIDNDTASSDYCPFANFHTRYQNC